jgi:hypothetical protein
MSTILSPFSSWLITFNFFSLLFVFRLFFTWMALDDVVLPLSLKLVRQENVAEEETTSAA